MPRGRQMGYAEAAWYRGIHPAVAPKGGKLSWHLRANNRLKPVVPGQNASLESFYRVQRKAAAPQQGGGHPFHLLRAAIA